MFQRQRKRAGKRQSMRYIVAKVEWYAHGRTYELRNVGIGASYGLGPTKILYCDQLYRFDRFYLDQSVLFLSRSHWSPLFYLHLARAGHVHFSLVISLTVKR